MVRPFPATLLAALLAAMPAAHGAPTDPAMPTHKVYLIGGLRLSHPHFRLEDGADNPTALIDIENRGAAPDRLLGASIDGATATSLAGGDTDGSLLIPPHATVSLTLSGPHFVTEGWVNPGSADGRLGATMRFARAGDLRVSFRRETDADPEPASAATTEKAIELDR